MTSLFNRFYLQLILDQNLVYLAWQPCSCQHRAIPKEGIWWCRSAWCASPLTHGSKIRSPSSDIPFHFLIMSWVTALLPFNATKYMAKGEFTTHNWWIFLSYWEGDWTQVPTYAWPNTVKHFVQYDWMLLTLRRTGCCCLRRSWVRTIVLIGHVIRAIVLKSSVPVRRQVPCLRVPENTLRTMRYILDLLNINCI